MKTLAYSVWIATAASLVVAALHWRSDNLRPHVGWGIASLAAIGGPLTALTLTAVWRLVRGTRRRRAFGWLMAGVTPVAWMIAYFAHLGLQAYVAEPLVFSTPVRIGLVWASPLLELDARRRYRRCTLGRHVTLLDDGRTPQASELVGQMDRHVARMARLLGQAAPRRRLPWVRGPALGFNRCAVGLWALCGHDDRPVELTHLDRHETAHTLITALAGPDHDPPMLLAEGWAETQCTSRAELIERLFLQRQAGQTQRLAELTAPAWYSRTSPTVYWHGGPLVHYLIERHGGPAFFRLYAGVRRETFAADCRAILGRSWSDVERGFWSWLDDQASSCRRAPRGFALERSPPEVRLLRADDAQAWRELTAACGKESSLPQALPECGAWSIEVQRTIADRQTSTPRRTGHFELRGAFRGGEFWMVEFRSRRAMRFLMHARGQCALLRRTRTGAVSGWVTGPANLPVIRAEALAAWRLFAGVADPAPLLALDGAASLPGRRRVGAIERLRDELGPRWRVWLTICAEEDAPPSSYRVELASGPPSRIVELHGAAPGAAFASGEEDRPALHRSLALLADAAHIRQPAADDKVLTRFRVRQLSQSEGFAIRRQVDSAAARGPSVTWVPSSSWLLAGAIGWPAASWGLLAGVRDRQRRWATEVTS